MEYLNVGSEPAIDAGGCQFACGGARRTCGVLKRTWIVLVGMCQRARVGAYQHYDEQYARMLPVLSADPHHVYTRFPKSRSSLFYDKWQPN